MAEIEYLAPEIANEGTSCNNWSPGEWTNAPAGSDEEYQPDIEPPHIPDYAMLKKHKHYKQYFRPHRYQPFPAWMYHATEEAKLVKTKEEVLALGPDWSPTPFKKRIDMTGKSLPVKSDTQRLTEALVAGMATQKPGAAVDPNAIAAIVAAVMAALPQQQAPVQQPAQPNPDDLMPAGDALSATSPAPAVDETVERAALLELADKNGVKVDGRWSIQRLRKELGL